MSERPQGVLVLTGSPGSGKTTVAELLSRRFERSVHLESDHFFHFIKGGYIEPWMREAREQNNFVMQLVGEIAIRYAKAGYYTIVDGIVLPDWFYWPLTEAIRSSGLQLATVILRPPLALCIERATSRASRPLADPAVIQQIWEGFSDLGDLEALVIDNGLLTAEETTEEIMRRLPDGRERGDSSKERG